MKSGNQLVRILKDYPLAVFCLIVILVCGAMILLRAGTAMELSTQEADLNTRIRTIDQNTKNAKNLKEEVAELELLVKQVDAKLFNREQRAININFFYGLEDRLDIRISNIAQLPEASPIYAKGGPRELKQHSTIMYSISLNGTFDKILSFLYELHRVDPLIRVADIQMTTASNSPTGVLEARLRLIVLAEKD